MVAGIKAGSKAYRDRVRAQLVGLDCGHRPDDGLALLSREVRVIAHAYLFSSLLPFFLRTYRLGRTGLNCRRSRARLSKGASE
jgi:hypothetical protein